MDVVHALKQLVVAQSVNNDCWYFHGGFAHTGEGREVSMVDVGGIN